MAKQIDVGAILEGYFRGLSYNEIARTRHVSKHSVQEVVFLAKKKGYSSLDEISQKTDEELYQEFFPDKIRPSAVFSPVDYSYVHRELNRTGVTLKLLWSEYCAECRLEGNVPVSYGSCKNGISHHFCPVSNLFVGCENDRCCLIRVADKCKESIGLAP